MKAKDFVVHITMDSKTTCHARNVARALERVAAALDVRFGPSDVSVPTHGTVRDVNGAVVGRWEIRVTEGCVADAFAAAGKDPKNVDDPMETSVESRAVPVDMTECVLCDGSGRIPVAETPDPPSDGGGWNDATRANLASRENAEAALASVRAKLFALDERVMLAESPRDLYDDVRDTLAGILVTGELAAAGREKDPKNAVEPMEIRDGSGSGIEIPPPDTRAVVHEIVREEALAAIRERDALRVEVERLRQRFVILSLEACEREEPDHVLARLERLIEEWRHGVHSDVGALAAVRDRVKPMETPDEEHAFVAGYAAGWDDHDGRVAMHKPKAAWAAYDARRATQRRGGST